MKKIILLVLVFLSAISFAEEAVADTTGEKSLKEVVYQYKTLILNEYQSDPETALIFYSSDMELSNVIKQYIKEVPKDLWSYPDEVVALAFGFKDSFMLEDSVGKIVEEWSLNPPSYKAYKISFSRVFTLDGANFKSELAEQEGASSELYIMLIFLTASAFFGMSLVLWARLFVSPLLTCFFWLGSLFLLFFYLIGLGAIITFIIALILLAFWMVGSFIADCKKEAKKIEENIRTIEETAKKAEEEDKK